MTASDGTAVRQRIIEQATHLFVSHGYHGVSMREIAAAVGLSKPGLYYHFRDKSDLFLAILSASLEALQVRVAAARDGGSTARAQVELLIRGLCEQAPEQRAIVRLASQELALLEPELREAFGRLYHERFIGQIEAMLSAGMQRGELRQLEPRVATWLLLGMLFPFVFSSYAAPRENLAALSQTIATIFFEGIAAPRAE